MCCSHIVRQEENDRIEHDDDSNSHCSYSNGTKICHISEYVINEYVCLN
jgi:hypothetical protein